MRTAGQLPISAKGKTVLIAVLYALSAAIILLGAGFSIYCAIHGVSFMVMTTKIPGVVFGMIILFLGARYFLAMSKLKDAVSRSTGFSWTNFRKGEAK